MTAAPPRLRLLEVNPTPGWRGGEAQTLLLCRGLAARGHEVLLAAAPGSELIGRAHAAGIGTRGVRIRGDGDLFGIAALARIASSFRPDLVHLHTSRAHAAGWGLSLLSRRLPVVVSRRVDFAPAGNPFTRLKYTSRVDCFLAVSRRVGDVLAASGVPRSRIRTVYSGIPSRARAAPARRAALRAELGIPSDAPIIGTVGALAAHKDPLTLVRGAAIAFRSQPRIHLVFVGEGALRQAIAREARALDIADRVVVAGFRNDPIDCLSIFDLFAVASRLEGLNTSVLDAMALGLPIVASRAGGIPELIGDDECGLLVSPGDPEAFAQAFLLLLGDPQGAARLGAAAVSRSREFSEERMVSETERVYQEVLTARGTREPGEVRNA